MTAKEEDHQNQEKGIIRIEQVTELTGLSKSTIRRMEEKGEFPKRKRLSPQTVGWSAEDIYEWIDTRPVAYTSYEEEKSK